MIGDDEERTNEWAKRINCAVEGVNYKGGKQVSNKCCRDASKAKTSRVIESILWGWPSCKELGCIYSNFRERSCRDQPDKNIEGRSCL